MSFTDYELNKAIGELARNSIKMQDDICISMSWGEKVEFLRARGWKQYGDDGDRWTKPEWGDSGVNIECAVKIAIRDEAKEKREVDRQREVRCNKCGCDMRKYETNAAIAGTMEGVTPAEPADSPFFWGTYGLIDAGCSGGYFSDPLSDGLNYRFSLCESCLWELFKTFKHAPEAECYI